MVSVHGIAVKPAAFDAMHRAAMACSDATTRVLATVSELRETATPAYVTDDGISERAVVLADDIEAAVRTLHKLTGHALALARDAAAANVAAEERSPAPTE